MKKERETANKYRQQALEGDLMAMNNMGCMLCARDSDGFIGLQPQALNMPNNGAGIIVTVYIK